MIRYQLATPVIIRDTTLIIIERLSIRAESSKVMCWLNTSKEPYALVIRKAGAVHAMNMAGQPVAITELGELVPGWDQSLDGK